MLKSITIACLLVSFNLNAQNLLNDIPRTTINENDSFIKHSYSYSNKVNLFSWTILSSLRYGAVFCGDSLTKFYIDLEAYKGKNDFLQLMTNKTLKKDSIYQLKMNIDPRFSLKKWAKGRVIKFAFMPETIQKENINFNTLIPFYTIKAVDIRKPDITNFIHNYKAIGNENALIIWTESTQSKYVVFTIEDICLHKINTNCETPFVKITNTKTIEISKKDTFKLFFETDIDTLNQNNLNKIETINLDINRIENIFCIGYADSTGSMQYNYNLSLRRALNIQSVLRQKYPNASITCSAKGALNNSNLSYNRRVEIIVIYK